MAEVFELELIKIQPSQLYISKKKLEIILTKFNPTDINTLGVIPIKKLGQDIIYTDGHTRAFVAYLKGFEKIQAEWETENLDWEMYQECVNWCKDENIYSIVDLRTRIIEHEDYKILWYDRCEKMQKEILERKKK
ncbi:MAG: hypothetical protein ACFFDW_05315 [Candidatus Thorarchaeota archaeon]